jgi:hypothetical protein
LRKKTISNLFCFFIFCDGDDDDDDDVYSRDVLVWPVIVMSYAMTMNDDFNDGDDSDDDAFHRRWFCFGQKIE